MRTAISTVVPFLFFLLLYSGGLEAQRDFRTGYIISAKGDTTRGWVLYKDIHSNMVCTFKTSMESKPAEFTPDQLRAYRFDDGKYFVSKNAPLQDGAKLMFLEFLIKGKASIYFLREGADHYFIEKDDGMMMELTEPEKIVSGENGASYVKPEQYTGKLKIAMADCKEIYPEIERLNLNHSSLIKLAKDYHSKVCTSEQCIVFERKKKPFGVNFSFYGGLTLSRVKFGGRLTTVKGTNGNIEYGDQLVSDYAFGGLIGGRVEFRNVFSSLEHASLMLDIAFQNLSRYRLTETGESDIIVYNGVSYRMAGEPASLFYLKSIDVDIKTAVLRIPVLFNYTFLIGKVRPYFNAGVMNMFVISQNKEFQLQRFMVEYGKSVPVYHLGFTGACGARLYTNERSFFFLDLGYVYTLSMNVWPTLRFITNQFELKAGFSF